MIVIKRLVVVGIALMVLPGLVAAQDSKSQGYLVDSYGNSISTSSNTGLCWRTSDWTPARAVAVCDPVDVPVPRPVAVAPPPPPRVAAVAAPPEKPATPAPVPIKIVPQSIAFSADALFIFDQFALKPEAKPVIDNFVRQLSGTQYDAIVVTGHTDRLGSTGYNQTLSERRAGALKDYLVNSGVPANRITAQGKGKTQPVTLPADCTSAQIATVIACLQPDRRVHVEVRGTKIAGN